MRITKKGQVTIPAHIREILGIMPENEVEFLEENGRVYIQKTPKGKRAKRFHDYGGRADIKMRTDEIMALTRGNS